MREATSKNSIDILGGNLWKGLLLFALPLAASSILQQLFNSVDVAVVGQFDSNQAVAAVGSNSPVINLFVNLFVGLAGGANVVIASYIGRGKVDRVENSIHTAILLGLISGFIMLGVGVGVAEPILRLMNSPEDVLPLAARYLRIYSLGMPFILTYNFGAAILRSVGDTKRPLYTLIASGLINTGLNVLLVVVFKLSVVGVAIATTVSNAFNAIVVIVLLLKEKGMLKLKINKLCIKKTELLQILKIGIPAGVQGIVFSLSNIFIQSAVNRFGSTVMAGSTAGLNFEAFSYCVVNAFSHAAATFIGQNFAAGNTDRCKKVFRISLLYAAGISGLMCAVFVIFRRFFAGLYTADNEACTYAMMRMLYVLSFACLTSTYEIPAGAMRGLSHALVPAALTVFGSCVLRIIWVYTVAAKFSTYLMLIIIYPISWAMTGLFVMTAYFICAAKEYKKSFTPPNKADEAEEGNVGA